MDLPLIITPEAEEDLADAKRWYDRQRRGLGQDFLLCVEEALERIRRIPQGASEVLPGVRRVVVRRFPYGVFYRVDPDQIAVIAVYDSRRDPRGWQARA
jgi:toxin ParE1/3/4